MKIIQHELQANQTNVRIIWDDGSTEIISTLVFERHRHQLTLQQTVEDELLKTIRQENDYESALKKGYDMLSRKSCTSCELRKKLMSLNFSETSIRDVIIRLKHLNYLNDEKILLDWAYYQLQEKPMGALKLKQMLLKRTNQTQLMQDIIRQVFSQNSEIELIQTCLNKKFKNKPFTNLKEKARAFRYLSSLGFRSHSIMQVIHHHPEDDFVA